MSLQPHVFRMSSARQITRSADKTDEFSSLLPILYFYFFNICRFKMLPTQTRNPAGRSTRVYNAAERAVIDVFKTQYMAATTPTARKTIAQVHILPALFNYWGGLGHAFNESEIELRIQVYVLYITRHCNMF